MVAEGKSEVEVKGGQIRILFLMTGSYRCEFLGRKICLQLCTELDDGSTALDFTPQIKAERELQVAQVA